MYNRTNVEKRDNGRNNSGRKEYIESGALKRFL